MGRKSFHGRNRHHPNNTCDASRPDFVKKAGIHNGDTSLRQPGERRPGHTFDLKEKHVYITEYVSTGEGFLGIIKSRFSDFHVNEIDSEGNEAVLNVLTVPNHPKEEMEEKPESEVESILTQLITKANVERIQEVAQEKGNNIDMVEIDVTELTKKERGQVHVGIQSLFGKHIIGNTVTRDERKYITITARSSSNHKDRRQKWLWPHPFTYFLLFKENVDTIQAVNKLVEALKCSKSALTYAGTKDRRGKTTQWLCIKQFHPNKIMAAANKINHIKVGNFCFRPTTLKLGQLRGNRFRIALRQVSADESVIRESINGIQEKGFINYFGLQRFGNNATAPTYKVGIEILKGCWKEACNLILMPRNGDMWFMKAMRETWEQTGDAATALTKLSPSNRGVEKDLLQWLASHHNDYKGALDHLARNLRLLYCHSYQSLIWNRVASRRLRELGYRVVAGDLVYVDKAAEEVSDSSSAKADVDAGGFKLDHKEAEESEVEESMAEISFKNLVKPLTDKDIESGQYTIFDIVLPLPGHDISYPTNDCGKWYEEFLAEDGLSSNSLKRNSKKESLPGAYRKVFMRPNIDWKLISYESPTDTLILSDLEKLAGEKEPESKEGAPYKALLLDFTLPPSTYATMALREILKSDTSSVNQRTLEKLCNESLPDEPQDEVQNDNKPQQTEPVDLEPAMKKPKLDVDDPPPNPAH
ncbi:pseudouridylate synthase 7 homolog isoform X1 [Topomyia yanbarensis]|uniref:pseudouridylate synthase 7 homolog isoform X1 n=1 Tax=Topomyia yanbarensis TaxID=2498891 RepID=UPI00273BE759|nr:pseudouridylate synthase 7 homolog isoform X1 [Topomyia yanbarensis]